MSQSLILKLSGLWTNYNDLGQEVPEGALLQANNVVIDKQSIAESRRGYAQLEYGLPLTSSRADKFYDYQSTLMAHYDANNLAYYNTSTGVQPYSASNIPSTFLTNTFGTIGTNKVTITAHGYTTGIPVALSTTASLPTGLSPQWTFTVTTASATAGATFTNNGYTFTVTKTLSSGTTLICTGAGTPTSSGTLTLVSGSGSATITFSAAANASYYLVAVDANTVSFATTYANAIAATPSVVGFTSTGASGTNMVIPQGAFRHPDPLLAKMRAAQANQNLYMTSSAGILKNDAIANTWKPAGMVQALDSTASLVATGSFTAANSTDTTANIASHGYTTGTAGTLGAASVFATSSISSNAVTITGHGYVTGEPIQVSITSGATLPTGLSAATTYYVIVTTVNAIKFATSNANALAGTPISISGGSGNINVLPQTVYIIVVDVNDVQFATTYANSLIGTEFSFAGIVSGGGTTASSFIPSAIGTGWFTTGNQVGYRILWGYTDANANEVLGAPSYQSVVTNNTGSATNVSLQITIPSTITTSDFFQVYRSTMSGSASTVPFDNGQLVYEGSPTAAQISALSLILIDVTPETLKGAALYTNSTQQGILAAYNPPPYATDMAVFYNCLFFANTQTVQTLNLSMLAVSGQYGVQVGDVITIGVNSFTAVNSTPTPNAGSFLVVTGGSPAQNLNSTAINLVQCINQCSTNSTIYAQYTSSVTGLPGQFMLQARVLGTAAFAVTYTNASGSTAGSTGWSPALPSSGTTVLSSNQSNLNGLMYSQQQIPDAVPSQNILFPGSASSKILRIIPLRTSMFIFKQDGIYRVTGSSPATFTIDLLDSTAILLAPESAVELNNQCYALTTQGVVAVSDTGVQIMSRAIEDQLLTLFELPNDVILGNTVTNCTNAYSFGVAYESDRKYILWTTTEDGDTSATQAFVYNYLTRAWTRWTRNQQHGLVLSADGRLYAADPNSSYIDQERKNGNYTDYTDEAYANTIESSSNYTLTLSTTENVNVGDLIYINNVLVSFVTAVNTGASQVTVNDLITWPTIDTFTSANVNTGSSKVTVTAHGYETGQLITLTGTITGGAGGRDIVLYYSE